MEVKDVLLKFHKKVPFPWTPSKIEKAGYSIKPFLLSVYEELEKCENIATPDGLAVLEILSRLET